MIDGGNHVPVLAHKGVLLSHAEIVCTFALSYAAIVYSYTIYSQNIILAISKNSVKPNICEMNNQPKC